MVFMFIHHQLLLLLFDFQCSDSMVGFDSCEVKTHTLRFDMNLNSKYESMRVYHGKSARQMDEIEQLNSFSIFPTHFSVDLFFPALFSPKPFRIVNWLHRLKFNWD